jgi:hypothetical protein
MRYLTDVHVSFTQQDLVPTEGYAAPDANTITAQGGDSFACYMSFMTAAPQNSNPDGTIGAPYEQGVRIWRGYVGYSRKNFNYRYQTEGNIGTYFHGRTDVRTLFTPNVNASNLAQGYQSLVNVSQSQNIVRYDTSMNASHIFSVGVISSPDLVQATEFPNTIIWSPVQNEESKEFSWRGFPAGNRYTINKNKGEIMNLQGMKNKELVIHTRHAIFRTRTDANVQAEDENIFFKSANLFDLPPEDMVPVPTGYGGTQHRLACVLTKVGYVYVDDSQGKVFLYDGQMLEELSTRGLRNFFRDEMHVGSGDNPLQGIGYTIAYDEHYNRLLVTKIKEDESWTISYDPQLKSWVSYHDYIPDYMFMTIGAGLYSLKESAWYKHNAGERMVYYGDKETFIMDICVASPTAKHFTGINWVTEATAPDGAMQYNETFDRVTLRTSDACTGQVAVVPFTDLYSSTNANVTRNLNRVWNFNDIRDIVINRPFITGFYTDYNVDPAKLDTNMEWYDRRFLIDKWLICRLESDNETGNKFILLEVDVTFDEIKR